MALKNIINKRYFILINAQFYRVRIFFLLHRKLKFNKPLFFYNFDETNKNNKIVSEKDKNKNRILAEKKIPNFELRIALDEVNCFELSVFVCARITSLFEIFKERKY